MTNVGGSLAVGATSYTDTTMIPGNTYTYETRSIDTAGNESAASGRVTIEVPGAPPPVGGSGGCQGQNCPPPIDARLILPSCGQPRPAAGPDEAAGGLCLPGERTGVLAGHTSAEPDFRIVFYHTDHLGTPRVLTDELGGVLSKHAFYPFGEEAPGPWPAAESTNTHWFTGHERDAGVDQDYVLARHHSSASGRFNQPDPGPTNVLLPIPVTFHRYSYTNDSPLLAYDPDGLATTVRCRGLNAGGGRHVGGPEARLLKHAQIFYGDGLQPPNSGYSPRGVGPDHPAELNHYGPPVYDNLNDPTMREAEQIVQATGHFDPEDYSKTSNNCHHYIDAVLEQYRRLLRGRRLLKKCKDERNVEACKRLQRDCENRQLPDQVCREYEDEKGKGNLPNHRFLAHTVPLGRPW
jgi:RHS repeat-associated protein